MRNLLLIILLTISNCFPPFVTEKPNNTNQQALILLLAASRRSQACAGFFIRDLFSGEAYCQSFRQVASGTNLEIYENSSINMERQFPGFSYSSVAQSFDNFIFPRVTNAIGTPTDVDNNNKIIILVYNIGNGVGGYFDPVNFLADDPSDSFGRSNQKEILYIDGSTLLNIRKRDLTANLPDPFLSTIAHELQHLIRFRYELGFSTIIRTLNDITNKNFVFDDIWINEGTSEVASDIAGYGPQTSRMACFRGDPNSGCTNGNTGVSLFNWNSSIRNYSSAYTFISYLYNTSSLNETDRNQFLRNSVQGNSSNTRASTINNLMTVFQSAPRYNSSILTTDQAGMFRRLYASFLSQAFNPARYPAATSTLFIGTTNTGNLTTLNTQYPLPTNLNQIYTHSSAFGIVKGSNFIMDPSVFYRVSENSSVAPDNSDAVKVWNGNPGAFGPEFILFNGRIDSNRIVSTASLNVSHRKNQYLNPENICPKSYLESYLNSKNSTSSNKFEDLRRNLAYIHCDLIE